MTFQRRLQRVARLPGNDTADDSVRNVGFMGASTGVRLLFGILTFAVMARLLGAADFGRLMTALAASVLAGLVANFGLATYVLREIGAASKDGARRIMGEVLSAKLLLVGLVTLAATLVLPWVHAPWRNLVALMLLAQVFDAVTDLLNVGFRATGRYAAETRVATVAALLQFGCVAATLHLWPSPMAAAAAYCTARGLVLLLTWRGQRSYFGGLRPAPWRLGMARLSAARAYASDYSLQALFGQVDSIVLAHYFGPAAVGLYQAGMRLFLGGAQAASVLGNVAIPKLAGLRAQGLSTADGAKRVQYAFLLVGAGGGLTLALLPESLITSTLGESFAGLATLLPWFGLLFLVRLSAAGWGLLLTVEGKQPARARLTAAHWAVVAVIAFAVLPHAGITGWLGALIVGNAALFLGYGLVLRRTDCSGVQGMPMLASLASCAVLLAIAIHSL